MIRPERYDYISVLHIRYFLKTSAPIPTRRDLQLRMRSSPITTDHKSGTLTAERRLGESPFNAATRNRSVSMRPLVASGVRLVFDNAFSTVETRPLEDRWRKYYACLSLNFQNANRKYIDSGNQTMNLFKLRCPSCGETRARHRLAPSRYSPVSADGCRWHPHGTCIRGESQAAVSVREVRNAFWCSHAHITLIRFSGCGLSISLAVGITWVFLATVM